MGLKEDLETRVGEIFRQAWTERDGTVVPDAEDIKLTNDAVKLTGTALYADMSGSTKLVDSYKAPFATEIYKAYLHCAAKIITSEGGVVTAYDGDRIMAVYLGNSKNTSAVRTALKINWARQYIVNVKLKAQYPNSTYQVKHTVGIDSSELYVARTGIRGSNDLVWVGRAANYAAKLSAESPSYPTYITATVRNNIHESVINSAKGFNMWTALTWSSMADQTIYGSTYWWSL
ncbi:MAG: adenylate/guanylate cyclase domain-containing protein [Acidobacteria bacterium]|nr:MAG: adenylate/guanylate cyclase domain-containing protein [Acidobacteriota bacterium]